MFQGLLEVSGTIDLDQFWPITESDADTVKVLVGANSFRFRKNAGAPFKVTHVFEGAKVIGKFSKPAIDKTQRVTIRLQGVDATELHYRPTAPTLNNTKPTKPQQASFKLVNGNFRQFFGETATVELHNFLAKVGKSPIKCVVRTAVDEPGDAFDTFGRLIGDIVVTTGGHEVDVNHWLCQNGWAFPTFYSSMSEQEINDLLDLTKKARSNKAGIWGRATSDLSKFDPKMVFRSHGVPNPATDRGLVYIPKLFRRRSTFGVALKSKMVTGTLKPYLQKEPDECFETSDFLKQGSHAAKIHHLDEFITPGSVFDVGPGDLVFRENSSTVIAKNGKTAQF
jgi:endonuclease YncB( thermonuclease family)